MSQTILVTGATGAVGLRVVQALCLAGYRICVFSTHAPKEGLFPQDVKTVLGDITDKIAVRSAMEGWMESFTLPLSFISSVLLLIWKSNTSELTWDEQKTWLKPR